MTTYRDESKTDFETFVTGKVALQSGDNTKISTVLTHIAQ